MSYQTLTPTQLVVDGAGLNITALLAAPTATTLLFANTGREFLIVTNSGSGSSVTVDVGALVDGQTVSNFSSVTLTEGDIYSFGPFHSVLDQSGTNEIQVVLSTTTDMSMALLQMAGVF